MTTHADLNPLLEELRRHHAHERSAPASLQQAYRDVCRQARANDLFLGATIDAARQALEADADRFSKIRAVELRKSSARSARAKKRKDRLTTFWAKCCTRLYHHDAASRGKWSTCLSCRKALTYGSGIPA